MTKQKTPKSAWIDFFICFFFGVYGIHKFREKKIGLGVLYLFTAGLFGFGWLFDCINYLIAAFRILSHKNDSMNGYQFPELQKHPKTSKFNITKIIIILTYRK